jgi:hypothetical protein
VIWLFYVCLVLGAVLLVADLAGRFTGPPERVRLWRAIGVLAAAGPGLGPMLGWLTGRLSVSWPYPLVAAAYFAAFVILATGVMGWRGRSASARLRRVGYLGLLVLGALPSWVLLFLAPAIAVAGVSLIQSPGAPAANDVRRP